MLADVEARLWDLLGSHVADGEPVLKEVSGAAAFTLIDTLPPLHLMPAAYVLPLQEVPVRREADALPQIVEVTIGIVLAVAAEHADPTGAGAVLRIAPVRRAIRQALMGWTPPGAESALAFAGGDLLGVEQGGLWWQDSFTTQVLYGGNE